jgi:hypothetical protein
MVPAPDTQADERQRYANMTAQRFAGIDGPSRAGSLAAAVPGLGVDMSDWMSPLVHQVACTNHAEDALGYHDRRDKGRKHRPGAEPFLPYGNDAGSAGPATSGASAQDVYRGNDQDDLDPRYKLF